MSDQAITTEFEANPGVDLSPVPPGLQAFTRGPSSVAALVERAETVESQFREFNNRLSRAEIELGTRTEKAVANIERLNRAFGLAERRRAVDQETAGLRREVDRKTEKGRYEVLRQMARAEEEVLAVESQFASPAHILMRSGLGSPERSRYQAQLSASGPLEIQNFAAHAVATGDKVLGAAILSRLDRMNRRERELTGVSRQELASALAGAEFKNAQAAIARIKNRLREAMDSNRAFSTGSRRLRAQSKIAMGLRRPSEVGAGDD